MTPARAIPFLEAHTAILARPSARPRSAGGAVDTLQCGSWRSCLARAAMRLTPPMRAAAKTRATRLRRRLYNLGGCTPSAGRPLAVEMKAAPQPSPSAFHSTTGPPGWKIASRPAYTQRQAEPDVNGARIQLYTAGRRRRRRSQGLVIMRRAACPRSSRWSISNWFARPPSRSIAASPNAPKRLAASCGDPTGPTSRRQAGENEGFTLSTTTCSRLPAVASGAVRSRRAADSGL